MKGNYNRGKIFVVGSVTKAMRGRELLFGRGIRSYIERNKSSREFGCGYSLRVPGNSENVPAILSQNGIRVLAVRDS